MNVSELQVPDIISYARNAVGISDNSENNIDDVFLAALVRHTAGSLCPCSPALIRSEIAESLQFLTNEVNLNEQIDVTIENLIVYGDLLELSDVSTTEEEVKGTWLFIAPPGFVERKNGEIYLTGIVPDQDTYLPRHLTSRITYSRFTRQIRPEEGEDLTSELTDLGLNQVTFDNWMKHPRRKRAQAHLDEYKEKLASSGNSGSIPSLQILNPDTKVDYYPGRWCLPGNLTGSFIARRLPEYGAPTWCFVALESGEARKLLDFPMPNNRFRGCDIAWHLQMATDHINNTPQEYRVSKFNNQVKLDFFSPIPLWAHRRLLMVGNIEQADKCLFSFKIKADDLQEEEIFLNENLWLRKKENQEEEN
jgi:hypothetical protein